MKNQYEENPFPRPRTTNLVLKDFIYKKTNCHFIDYGSEKRKSNVGPANFKINK